MIFERIEDHEKSAKTVEGLPATTQQALALSIENAARRFYQVSDCLVDIELRTINLVFQMPRHQRIIEQLGLIDQVLADDILPVTLKLAALPKTVKAAAWLLFPETLRELQIRDVFSMWKRQARQIISGAIRRRLSDHVEVDLNGAVGILPQNAWVPTETHLYHPGSVMFFQVSAVKRSPSHVFIRLSRSSINLPALLLEFYLPMHKFVCMRRFIGQKSLVRTNAKVWDKDVIRVREKVSRELLGEIIELRPF